jgi:hypothetical protein
MLMRQPHLRCIAAPVLCLPPVHTLIAQHERIDVVPRPQDDCAAAHLPIPAGRAGRCKVADSMCIISMPTLSKTKFLRQQGSAMSWCTPVPLPVEAAPQCPAWPSAPPVQEHSSRQAMTQQGLALVSSLGPQQCLLASLPPKIMPSHTTRPGAPCSPHCIVVPLVALQHCRVVLHQL